MPVYQNYCALLGYKYRSYIMTKSKNTILSQINLSILLPLKPKKLKVFSFKY